MSLAFVRNGNTGNRVLFAACRAIWRPPERLGCLKTPLELANRLDVWFFIQPETIPMHVRSRITDLTMVLSVIEIEVKRVRTV